VGFGITDATPLGSLPRLTDLVLADNAITKIDVLADERWLDDGLPGLGDPPAARPGYSQTGSWTVSQAGGIGAVNDDYRFAEGVGASAAATATANWEFRDLAPGNYRVWATWPEHETRATDAPFAVSLIRRQAGVDTTQALAERIVINQRLAPSTPLDPAAPSAVTWESLGDFVVTAGDAGTAATLRVTLSNNASGLVAADAIRLEQITDATGSLVGHPRRIDLRGNPLDNTARDHLLTGGSAATGGTRTGRLAGSSQTVVQWTEDLAGPALSDRLADFAMLDEPPLTGSRTAGVTGAFGWANALLQTQASGTTDDKSRVYSVATDAAGDVYAVGEFNGRVDFDPDPTATAILVADGTDGYLAKYDPAGRLRWVIPFSSTGGREEIARGVAVDRQGNVIVTGKFSGTMDIDSSSAGQNLTTNDVDAFIVKYDPSGTLLWGAALEGAGSSDAYALAVDRTSDAIVIGGTFWGTVDFNPSSATSALSNAATNDGDAFVAKYDGQGQLVWTTKLAGNRWDVVEGIAIDSSGAVIATGSFASATLQVLSASGAVGGKHVQTSTNVAWGDGVIAKVPRWIRILPLVEIAWLRERRPHQGRRRRLLGSDHHWRLLQWRGCSWPEWLDHFFPERVILGNKQS